MQKNKKIKIQAKILTYMVSFVVASLLVYALYGLIYELEHELLTSITLLLILIIPFNSITFYVFGSAQSRGFMQAMRLVKKIQLPKDATQSKKIPDEIPKPQKQKSPGFSVRERKIQGMIDL